MFHLQFHNPVGMIIKLTFSNSYLKIEIINDLQESYCHLFFLLDVIVLELFYLWISECSVRLYAWKHILRTVGNCHFGMFLQTKVLTAVFSLSHGDFLSSWCSSDLPVKEEDATLEYDSFAAAGWVLENFSSLGPLRPKSLDFTLIPSIMAPASYAHQRTSLFVKVIANLHCFVPTICEG